MILVNKNHFLILIVVLIYILIYLFRYNQAKNLDIKNGEENGIEFFSIFRKQLDNKIFQLLPSPQSQLLSGILLGEKKDLPGDFKIALRDSSTLHIVVVSGQNLAMLAGLFLSLSGIIHRKIAIYISVCAIIFYTLLTGAQIPVIRAAVMSVLAFLAVLLGRQSYGVWVLLISGGILLLISPLWVEELSFQLSFLASFGVITIAPIILKLLKHLPRFIANDLAITLGAQLMVIPIIAQNFHQVSLVAVFTNILIGWTVPLIMIIGGIMLLFSIVFLPIAQLLAEIANILLIYFVYVVKFFGSLDFAWEYIGEKSLIFWVGYYLVLVGILTAVNKKIDVRD